MCQDPRYHLAECLWLRVFYKPASKVAVDLQLPQNFTWGKISFQASSHYCWQLWDFFEVIFLPGSFLMVPPNTAAQLPSEQASKQGSQKGSLTGKVILLPNLRGESPSLLLYSVNQKDISKPNPHSRGEADTRLQIPRDGDHCGSLQRLLTILPQLRAKDREIIRRNSKMHL